MPLCSTLKFSICDMYNMFCAVLMQHFTQNLFRFYVNYIIQYNLLITVEAIIMFLYKRIICYILENLILFCH